LGRSVGRDGRRRRDGSSRDRRCRRRGGRGAPDGRAPRQEGDDSAAAELWQDAYEDYLASIRIDPTRPEVRKKLERVRDERLGLTEEDEKEKDEGDADEARAGE
jgi:hypothetical protein